MVTLTAEQAWDVLARVADPEIPVISVTELGIVREVSSGADAVEVVVTPTYSGCPATEAIERSIVAALRAAGAPDVRVRTRLAPGWEESVRPVLDVATLQVPARPPFLSRGKEGRHSEHMGHLLAEMQYLQRAYPGATW